mmetsp:Transcript_39329/g.48700  ORF Transcript_39329/g.48700 Transcript_39329/m.48700 type:complete len:312 (-) Transcript_39329:14-949(-)
MQNELNVYRTYKDDSNIGLIMARNNSLSQVNQENIKLKKMNEYLKKQLKIYESNLPERLPKKMSSTNESKNNDNNNEYSNEEETFYCQTCKKWKPKSKKLVYTKCGHYHCSKCVETILMADILKNKIPLKCYECRTKILESDLKKISLELIEAYYNRDKFSVSKQCLKCHKENKLSKWKVKPDSYQCPTKNCDYEFCNKCKYSMDIKHGILGCDKNKLLYEDSKHYIFCPKGHISYNISDINSRKDYQRIGKCSDQTCYMKHCYQCSQSFKPTKKHVCLGADAYQLDAVAKLFKGPVGQIVGLDQRVNASF